MKYLMVLLLMTIGTWSHAQEGTTEEEYKFLTKGYAYQSDMGLDHKKEGYLIQKIYVAENEVKFIGMFHSFSGKTKAYLAIIPQADKSDIHICIPNNAATETIRRRYLADKRQLLSTAALQDQFDEAWRSFFFHQSSTGLNWMQDKEPKSVDITRTKNSADTEHETNPEMDEVQAPVKPEMTSKGIPVKVQTYESLTNTLKKDQENEMNAAANAKAINSEQQVSINGNIEGELMDRPIVKAPTVKENYLGKGKVVIKVCVDQSGDVIYAKFTQRGSTTFNTQLKKLALDSVHDAIFEPAEIKEQCGFIAFNFQ